MNIFATSPKPVVCARALDDRRVIKMALESAQVLCVATGQSGRDPRLYRPTHTHHPIVLWAADPVNWHWLYRHWRALCDEYRHRFGPDKRHATEDLPLAEWLQPTSRSPGDWANCTDFRALGDVHLAYRMHLARRWQTQEPPPRWTNRMPPEWFAALLRAGVA